MIPDEKDLGEGEAGGLQETSGEKKNETGGNNAHSNTQ